MEKQWTTADKWAQLVAYLGSALTARRKDTGEIDADYVRRDQLAILELGWRAATA